MAICCLFIYKNVNLKFQTENPFNENLSLDFDLGYLKWTPTILKRVILQNQKDSNHKIILKKKKRR